MKVKDLKKIVKESVKEVIKEDVERAVRNVVKNEMKTIIREAVFSKGALSEIIAESVSGVMKGTGGPQRRSLQEQGANPTQQKRMPQSDTQKPNKNMKKLSENFKKMFDGVDVTQGTEPIDDNSQMPQLGNAAVPSTQQGGSNARIKQLEQQVRNEGGAVAQQTIPQQQGSGMGQPGASRLNLRKKEKDRGYVKNDPASRKQAQKEAQRDQEFIKKLKGARSESQEFMKKLANKKMREAQGK